MPLVTIQNMVPILDQLNQYAHEVDSRDYGYVSKHNLAFKRHLWHHLNTPKAIIHELDAHLDNKDIRRDRVMVALDGNDYATAEKLSLESNFLPELTQIYERTHQDDKLIDVLKQRVLKGNLKLTKQLKELSEHHHRWASDRDDLSNQISETTDVMTAAKLLSNLKNTAALRDLLHENRDTTMTTYLFQNYTDEVYAAFPEQLKADYHEILLTMAETSGNRKDYDAIGWMLFRYQEFGDVA
ncbi:hypothetical protein [Secundilactobacillus paracollinoides]|uniref:hypothetical protein n=1 Tax=Secundilactobacillus paracollinoides TaxID=240427 RepID=UPI0006D0D50A|nr:hypothetical protein [Secundilactobacillus paracollinoides]KRL76969.1 hypothetical protein FC17_GL001423 [Secundilactobacillus paracollinoides DSM 15502 = JCM 11969]